MSLKYKLIYLILFLIILPILGLGYLFNYQTKNVMRKDKIEAIYSVINQNIDSANQFLDQYKFITVLNSRYPPIQGIIRSSQNGGIDPIDGSSLDHWKKRLESIFVSELEIFDTIYQIRYLDETGQEIVRVQRYKNEIYVIPQEQLQNKADRYYFQEIQTLNDEDVYISHVDLNVEHGEIQHPFIATIRFNKKITSAVDGSFKGGIVLNFDAEKLLHQLDTSIVEDSFILNQDGYFISHQDKLKLFGFQLGHENNYFKEQPILAENAKKADSKIFYDKNIQEYRVWKKFFYQKDDKERYWIVVNKFKESTILKLFYRLHKMFILIGVVLLLFIMIMVWFFAGGIISPIIEMSEVQDDIEGFQINPKLKKRKDEIGQLANAIERMGQKLKKSNLELDAIVKEKTKELYKRMRELEQFNEAMVGREKRMIELKILINQLSRELGRKPPFELKD